MAKPDYDFRAHPTRCIRIFSELNDQIVSNVVAQIIELKGKSLEPITVYINSPGGVVRGLEIISGCLAAKDADGKKTRLITVAIGDAASAAATLLVLGDYAIAYPYSVIHFHGIRMSEVAVTMEDASSIAIYLARRNREIALKLANSMLPRMIHRYVRVKGSFTKLRAEQDKDKLINIECFIEAIRRRVGLDADEVLERTLYSFRNAVILANKLSEKQKEIEKETKGASPVQYDAIILKHLLDYELKANEGDLDWRLDEQGLERVTADFLLLRDFHIGDHLRFIDSIIEDFGVEFLSDDDYKEYQKLERKKPKEAAAFLKKKVHLELIHFWNFAVSLCRNLQQGENRLSAKDAYWIGAIDEVVGTGLHGDRALAEAEEDQQLELTSASSSVK